MKNDYRALSGILAMIVFVAILVGIGYWQGEHNGYLLGKYDQSMGIEVGR